MIIESIIIQAIIISILLIIILVQRHIVKREKTKVKYKNDLIKELQKTLRKNTRLPENEATDFSDLIGSGDIHGSD